MSTLKVDAIVDKDSGNTTTINGTTIGPNLSINSHNTQGKNLIINGAMNVAQRGTSFTTTSAYTLDRWTFQTDLLDQYAHTVTQSTDTPGGFASSLKIEVTTSETSVESTEDLAVTQRIEAQNLQHLQAGTSSAKSLTLSFYVKSSVTGVYAVHLQAIDDSKIFPTTYTINSANTWEYKTITIPPCTIATIDNDNGTGLNLTFITLTGSTYTAGSTGSWQSYASNLFAAGMTANVSSDGDTWLITGVQLELGDAATEFEHESYGQTLSKCQRYYYRIGPEAAYTRFGIASNLTTTAAEVYNYLPVSMRSNPSVETTGTLSNYALYDSDDVLTATSIAIEGGNNDGNQLVILDVGVSSGLTDGGSSQLMASNNSSVFLAFSSEL